DCEFQQEPVSEMQQLREQLGKQVGAKPGIKPGRVAGPRRKFLECYRRYARRPADELLPALRDLLQKAGQFQDRHASIFHPRPVADERLLQRLAEIGPYDVDLDDRRVSVSWDA